MERRILFKVVKLFPSLFKTKFLATAADPPIAFEVKPYTSTTSKKRSRWMVYSTALILSLVVVLGMIAPALAATYSIYALAPDVSTATINDAIFESFTTEGSTGTGVFKPFLQVVQMGGHPKSPVYGYTFNGSLSWETTFYTSEPTYTPTYDEIPKVTRDSIEYLEFVLDSNQNKGGSSENITWDELKIYQSDVVEPAWDKLGTPVYDLGSNTLIINGQYGQGSGKGDVKILVPASAFHDTETLPYVHVWVMFGGIEPDPGEETLDTASEYPNNDGFEEFGYLVYTCCDLTINCPDDVTIECDESTGPDNTGWATASGCEDIQIAYNDVVTPGGCTGNYTIARAWTATALNACSSANYTQIITVRNTTPPVITCPVDITVECDDIPAVGTANATDNCDDDPTVIYDGEVIISGNCNGTYTIERTWTATDDCGNSANGTQIITVQDTTPPVIVCPPDVTVKIGESTDPYYTGNATTFDNCSNVNIKYTDDVDDNDPCNVIVTRSWMATDQCGNTANCTQIITVHNNPPIARFYSSPIDPWEGDFIEFVDNSTDPDGDEIVSWEWNIHWDWDLDGQVNYTTVNDGIEPTEPICGSDLRNPFFIPVDEGSYLVTLYVTDAYGATGNVTQTIIVDNAPPAVNALNVEVLHGENATLFGRFIDPGWQDFNHTANWIIDGIGIILGTVNETNQAFMSTGVVTGTFDTSSFDVGDTINGTLLVSDSINSSSNDFTISIIGTDIDDAEPNDTIATATPHPSDNISLSYIQTAGDIDIYEILDANGDQLPVGSEALVTLENLPNDYDMAIIAQLPEGLEPGAYQMGGYQMGAYQMGGFQMGAYQMGAYQMGGYQMGAYQMGAFQMGAYQMGAYQMGAYQMGAFQMGAYQMGAYQMGAYQMGAFQMGAFQMGAYQMGAFQMGAYQMGGFQMGAFQMGAFQMGAFQMGAYQMGGFQMGDGSADYPLSQIIFSGIDGTPNDSIGGTDISLAELGLSLEELTEGSEGTFQVTGFSANHGLNEEVLLARVDTAGTRLFVVVAGANGAFNPIAPYSLKIETSQPLDIGSLLTQYGIEYPAPDGLDYGEHETIQIYSTTTTSNPETLFVTQKERMIGRYGDNWTELETAISNLCDHPKIAGTLISVPESTYLDWDSDYSNIDEVNNVVDAIRDEINSYLAAYPSIEYIVIVGNDDIIPFHRDLDMTSVGNERQYAMTSFIRPGSPIFYSLLGGYILTDDYLVDKLPILWQGRPSYVPDLSVARLVETPDEIAAAAEAFMVSNGTLSLETALVTGYDFFNDGAIAVINKLENAALSVESLVAPDIWDADDLYDLYLAGDSYDVNNINAHYTHYTLLSYAGYDTADYSDIITSTQIDDAAMKDTVVYTIGCHAGLNVPDEAAPDPDALGLAINPQLDHPQALNQAILVGSTGYGYGDDTGIGGTEELIGIFTEQLLTSATVGESLVNAKQIYRTGSTTWTAYDEKSSIQFTMYGLPQYTVSNPVTLSSESVLTAMSQTLDSTGETLFFGNIALAPVETESGDYYTSGGHYQSTPFRPVQPKIVQPLTVNGNNLVHGVVLLGGTYEDIPGFDPVITRPTTEWELVTEEIQLLPQARWPSEIGTVNTLDTGSELIQTLIVTPGQFLPTGTENISGVAQIIGTQRLYHDLELLLTYSSSADYEPPTVTSIDLSEAGDNVIVSITASDVSGISRIIILQYDDNTGTVVKVGDLSPDGLPLAGTFDVEIPDPGDDSLIIQTIDGAGNSCTNTGRGTAYNIIRIETEPVVIAQENIPFTLIAYVTEFADLTPPVFYTWDLGDGTYAQGISANGTIKVVNYIYPDDYPTTEPTDNFTTMLKVTDSAGGIGNAEVIITVQDLVPVVNIDSVIAENNDEGDTVYLEGSFTDIGILDTHTGVIDWGDDTIESLDITQGMGSGTYEASHLYKDDPAGEDDIYEITVYITDKDTLTGESTTTITVSNVLPVLTVEPPASPVFEGDAVNINGSFTDAGVLDTHTAEIDWGDGNITELPTLDEENGSGTLSAQHQYLDDPEGEDNAYLITVNLTDKDGGTDNETTSITVQNANPIVSLNPITQTIYTGIPFELTGSYFDPGILDILSARVDWGDGSIEPLNLSSVNGSGIFSSEHTYALNGYYTITVTIADDDGGAGSDSIIAKVNAYWTDAEDYPYDPDGDLIIGMMDNNETTMTITLGVKGQITDEFQYRIKLHIEETNQVYPIKWDGKKVTGVKGAKAVIDENDPSLLHISFGMDKIEVTSGNHIEVVAETQAGTPSEPGAGIPDTMPDEGYFTYLVY